MTVQSRGQETCIPNACSSCISSILRGVNTPWPAILYETDLTTTEYGGLDHHMERVHRQEDLKTNAYTCQATTQPKPHVSLRADSGNSAKLSPRRSACSNNPALPACLAALPNLPCLRARPGDLISYLLAAFANKVRLSHQFLKLEFLFETKHLSLRSAGESLLSNSQSFPFYKNDATTHFTRILYRQAYELHFQLSLSPLTQTDPFSPFTQDPRYTRRS